MRLLLPVAKHTVTGSSWPVTAFADRFRIADLRRTSIDSTGRFLAWRQTRAIGQLRPVKIKPGNDCNGLVTGHRLGNPIERRRSDLLSGRLNPKPASRSLLLWTKEQFQS